MSDSDIELGLDVLQVVVSVAVFGYAAWFAFNTWTECQELFQTQWGA